MPRGDVSFPRGDVPFPRGDVAPIGAKGARVCVVCVGTNPGSGRPAPDSGPSRRPPVWLEKQVPGPRLGSESGSDPSSESGTGPWADAGCVVRPAPPFLRAGEGFWPARDFGILGAAVKMFAGCGGEDFCGPAGRPARGFGRLGGRFRVGCGRSGPGSPGRKRPAGTWPGKRASWRKPEPAVPARRAAGPGRFFCRAPPARADGAVPVLLYNNNNNNNNNNSKNNDNESNNNDNANNINSEINAAGSWTRSAAAAGRSAAWTA